MTRILALSGSLRRQSFNTALARAAQAAAGPEVIVEVATLHGIPLYDGDLEAAEGVPAAVLALAEKIRACDGLLLSTPEYNNGIPGVFKNGIDWLSRQGVAGGKLFAGKPVAVIGASPGGFGSILAQNAWLPVLRTLGMSHWAGGRLMVSRAHQLMDADGNLADEATQKLLGEFVAGFAGFIRG